VENLLLYKQPSLKASAGKLQLIHYQTLEAVGQEELRALCRIKDRFNEHRNFFDRIKLWRKSDILEGLEPKGARWGFTRAHGEQDRLKVILTIRRLSQATPRLTWIVYDEGNGGREFVLRGGRPVA
jgi:hypothetical protein